MPLLPSASSLAKPLTARDSVSRENSMPSLRENSMPVLPTMVLTANDTSVLVQSSPALLPRVHRVSAVHASPLLASRQSPPPTARNALPLGTQVDASPTLIARASPPPASRAEL